MSRSTTLCIENSILILMILWLIPARGTGRQELVLFKHCRMRDLIRGLVLDEFEKIDASNIESMNHSPYRYGKSMFVT